MMISASVSITYIKQHTVVVQISKCVFLIEPVWKVARYTSAAPLIFSEMDHYVDGAVLANNPCEYALTAINNFYRY